MIKLILLLIYILLILTVIFLERKSPAEALLWVLVMVCLPYAGAVLYLVFGSTMAAANIIIIVMMAVMLVTLCMYIPVFRKMGRSESLGD